MSIIDFPITCSTYKADDLDLANYKFFEQLICNTITNMNYIHLLLVSGSLFSQLVKTQNSGDRPICYTMGECPPGEVCISRSKFDNSG